MEEVKVKVPKVRDMKYIHISTTIGTAIGVVITLISTTAFLVNKFDKVENILNNTISKMDVAFQHIETAYNKMDDRVTFLERK